jgi:hypothetical protein
MTEPVSVANPLPVNAPVSSVAAIGAVRSSVDGGTKVNSKGSSSTS